MKIKKILSVLVACITLLGAILPTASMAKAASDAEQLVFEAKILLVVEEYFEANPSVRDKLEEELVREQARFSEMSIEELNSYIDAKMSNVQADMKGLSLKAELTPKIILGIIIAYYEWKLAWLAAAQIARRVGYPHAATLVEHSVRGKNYCEETGIPYDNGLMSHGIVKTQGFKTYFKKAQSNNDPGWFVITKNDNKDLFFALHKVESSVKKQGSMYTVTIIDKFNFKKENYADLFVGVVNNWAYLCQGAFILRSISVKLIFKQEA